MSLTTSFVFYLFFGLGVAVALFSRDSDRTGRDGAFRIASAFLFWPLYLPLLLERRPQANAAEATSSAAGSVDALTQAIQQVESELDAALGSLDGWAEEVLADESRRLQELRGTWRFQADRIRQLDRLLAASHQAESDLFSGEVSETSTSTTDRRLRSDHARTENLRRLQELRARLLDELLGTLAWVRELVTMIHLAKFSGAPPCRAEELLSQIAAAVEGLSEASTWVESSPSDGVAAPSVR